MEPSRVFLKVRAVAFSCIGFTSLVWIVLLCVVAFLRWDLSATAERSMMILALLANAITIIMLLILILLPFRLWLDTARLLFLLLLHVGLAAAFTYFNSKLECPIQTGDNDGICKLIDMYMLLASWVIPGFLIAYSSWLIFVVYRHWRMTTPGMPTVDDEEAALSRKSTLPTTHPSMSSRGSTLTWSEPNRIPERISSNSSLTSDTDGRTRPNRLSKQRPWAYAI